MNGLKRFLAPPAFADDVEKTRVAGILHVILLAITGVSLLSLAVLPFAKYAVVGLAIVVPLAVVCLVAWGLLRVGYVYGVARFLVAFLWLTTTIAIIISGGAASPETAGYLVVIAVAGILSGIRTMLLFTGLGIVGIVGIFIWETTGQLPPLMKMEPLGGMVIAIANPLALSAVFYLALSSVRQSFTEARRSSQALAGRNRELETIRASLEDQVAKRTQAAETARLDAEKANTALHEQMWQVAGLAQLGDVMRDVEDVPALAHAVLEHLCRYLDAQVGALYVFDDNWLTLVGTYAYHADAAHPRQFALGEGLVGQVAVKGLPYKLDGTDHPFKLNSSFGEIVLAQVILYPLLYAGAIIGVLELGRMRPFAEAHEQFLEQALERLAVVIRTVRAHAQINALLQETQRQTEELRVREEELRATNEELSAQTEALRDLH